MPYRFLADLVLGLHFLFVVFVVLGGLLLVRWPRLAWIHLPAAIWGATIEAGASICPLTPLENALRARAGEAGYQGGFIEHYILPVLYPGNLTRGIQLALAAVVIVVNLGVYGYVFRRARPRP
jgi:hypothetical protein